MSGAGVPGSPVGRRGWVVEFDEAVGLGVVAAGEGPSGSSGSSGLDRFPFHCTQIEGGSRTIEVGTEVTFAVAAGRLGRWEAVGVAPA